MKKEFPKEFPIVWNGEEFDRLEERPWNSPDAIQITIDHTCKVTVSEDKKNVVIEKDGKEVVSIRFPDVGKTEYRIYDFFGLFELVEIAIERVKSYKKEEK